MNLLLQLSLLIGLCLAGQLLSTALPFPMPGSVWAMALLFLLLRFGILKERHIERPASFLLGYLALFLVPAGVSILQDVSVLSYAVWQILVICLVTTPLTLLTAYFVTHGLIRLLDKRKEGKA